MNNLKEFSRCMALMSDKLQLLASRDVSTVQPSPSPSAVAAGVATPPPPHANAAVHSSTATSRPSPAASGDPAGAAPPTRTSSGGPPRPEPIPGAAAFVEAHTPVPTVAGAAPGATGLISDHTSDTGLPVLHPEPPLGQPALLAPAPGSGAGLQGAGAAAAGPLGALRTPAAVRAHWAHVAQALNMTAQQLADSAALGELHQGWLKRVHTDRQRLSAMLDEVLRVDKYGGGAYQEGLAGGGFTGPQGVSTFATHTATARVCLVARGSGV